MVPNPSAGSLGEFLFRYATGDWQVLFPERDVAVDDAGISAQADGTVTPTMAWSALKLIAIQVVREDEGTVVALWQLAADEPVSPMHTLFVPVTLSARPDELTARLLAIPGFDESAFAAAKAAEERDEPGSFLCWHDPSVDTTALSLEGPTPDAFRGPSAEDVARGRFRSRRLPS